MKRSAWMTRGWRVGICLLAWAPGLAGAAYAQAAPSEEKTWYAQRVNRGSGGLSVEHLWSKGASLRSEVVVGAHPIVTVVHGSRYWVIDPLVGEGISVERHPNSVAADNPEIRPFGDEVERLQAEGGEFVGDEDFGDVSCRLYKLTDDRGRQEVCARDDDLALPMFLRTWDRKTNRNAVVQYVNWIHDLEIASDFFAPGAGMDVKAYTYEAFVKAANEGTLGPTPVLYPHLLHGERVE